MADHPPPWRWGKDQTLYDARGDFVLTDHGLEPSDREAIRSLHAMKRLLKTFVEIGDWERDSHLLSEATELLERIDTAKADW